MFSAGLVVPRAAAASSRMGISCGPWRMQRTLPLASRHRPRQSLEMLNSHLLEAGSARTHILSLQVILADIGNRGVFETQWQEWIGPNPESWPQRACFQSGLAPGLQIELVAVAAPAVRESK